MPFRRRPAADWLYAALALAALALLHGGMNLLRGHVPFDERMIHLPNAVLSMRQIFSGVPPLWNPHVFSGIPHLASHHAAALYPPLYIFLPIFGAFRGFAIMQAAHYWFAGLGVFALLRRGWGLRFAPSLLGGAGFMLSGFLIAHEPHSPMIWAAAWIPWILWQSRRLLAGRPFAGPILAALVTIQITAGYMQVSVMTWLVASLEALVLCRSLRRLPAWALAIAIGVGLMAVQFLATREILPYTPRAHLDFAAFTHLAFPLPQLATLLFPLLFGTGVPDAPLARPWFGAGEIPEMVGSIAGVLWLGLVLAALIPAPAGAPRLRRERIFWTLITLAALSLTLGPHSPLARLLFHIPVLNLFRIQNRWLLFAGLAAALLAATGFERLLAALETGDRRSPRRALAVAAALLLAALPAAWAWLKWTGPRSAMPVDWAWFFGDVFDIRNPALWLPAAVWAAALAGLALLSLRPRLAPAVLLFWFALLGGEMSLLARQVVMRIANDPALAIPPANEAAASMLAVASPGTFRFLTPTEDAMGQHEETLPQSLAILSGLHCAGGNWPLVPPDYLALLEYNNWGWTREPRELLRRPWILSMLNIRFLLVGFTLGEPGDYDYHPELPPPPLLDDIRTDPAFSYLRVLDRTRRGITLVENTRVLPRAWLVSRLTPVASAADAVARLHAGPFDPAAEALVELSAAMPATTFSTLGTGTVRELDRRDDRLRFETDITGAPGFLVLSEQWHPGWRAAIDGTTAPLYRVNGVLRGLSVPEGRHAIELLYRPAGLMRGFVISLLFAAAWCGWLAAETLLRRRARRSIR